MTGRHTKPCSFVIGRFNMKIDVKFMYIQLKNYINTGNFTDVHIQGL